MHDDRSQIAWRAASDLPRAAVVNLGRGLPILVADHTAPDSTIMFQSENGILGTGPRPSPGLEDWSLTNASKQPVSLRPGASVFDLAESFDMIRGGHVDLALLGAFQISCGGDIANWAFESNGELPPAVGGAMDLAAGCGEVWALTTHCDRDGQPKLVKQCTLPLTAGGVVKRIYTERGTFLPHPAGGFRVIERDHTLSVQELQNSTGARLIDADTAPPLRRPS